MQTLWVPQNADGSFSTTNYESREEAGIAKDVTPVMFAAVEAGAWINREEAKAALGLPVPEPQVSFEDTTHAYESGYRDGMAKGRGEVGNPISGDLVSREAAIAALEKMPRRSEPQGGQSASYVHLGEAALAIRALPAAPAVKVKPLVWGLISDPRGGLVAISVGGAYIIRKREGGGYRLSSPWESGWRCFCTQEEAQKGAFDIEAARILAALEGGE